jgi:transposase
MLRPDAEMTIPEETERVAKAAFPKGNVYMQIRDVLGPIYQDEAFRNLFSRTGQPALAPWRLALVTVMQFGEGLTDRQAADAVRGRLDWKYVLGLALTDPGFDHTVLSEFRARLVAGGGEAYLLDALLKGCQAKGWLKARGQQRTDSTHILAAIHVLHRVELVGQTLQYALNNLAQIAPAWLKSRVPMDWFERYGRKLDDYRLPKTEAERAPVAEQIGRDGQCLLAWIDEETTPTEVQTCPAIAILRQVWTQQYELNGEQAVAWRPNGTLIPSAQRISTPHDPEARYSAKHGMEWVGYRVHLTECCQATLPHLITHVETTPAPVQDLNVLDDIHEALDKRDLLPSQHLVDTGYVSAARLSNSQQDYAVDVVGPARADASWQARTEGAYDTSCFRIDWDHFQTVCPQGKVSQYWEFKTGTDDNPIIEMNFRPQDCLPCPARALCTHSPSAPRVLAILPKELFLPLQAARQRQTTAEFKAIYAKRAGVEGTMSQAAIALDLRHARYIGLARTHLQAVVTAVAVNFKRLVAWLDGEPLAPTRRSPFAALAPSP